MQPVVCHEYIRWASKSKFHTCAYDVGEGCRYSCCGKVGLDVGDREGIAD